MSTTGGRDAAELLPRLAVWVTLAFTVVALSASIWSTLRPVAVVFDLVLFLIGCLAFVWAYLRAIGRSRGEAISLSGLFFLGEGVAPKRVMRLLWGCLAVQVVVAVATAAVRPFSELAFGVLVPMFGLATLAVWAAAFGVFPPRERPAVE